MMSYLLLLREDILHILVIMSETYFCFHLVRLMYCQALLVMPQGDDHDYSPLFVGGRQTLRVLTCFALTTFVALTHIS